MNFKVGDIVRGNNNHINRNRQLDKGFIAKVEDKYLWVVWFEQGYDVQAAFAEELVLLWRGPQGYLE